MKAILVMAAKDVRLLIRDKAGFFFTFFFPVIYASFFGLIFSGASTRDGGQKIQIALVDEDRSAQSAAFIEQLRQTKGISFNMYDRAAAATRVRTANEAAYVLIPRGFGQAREHPFWGGPPKLEIGVDPSRFAESAMLEGLLTQEMAKGLQDLFNSPRKMTGELSESVEALRNDPDADPSFIAAMQLFSNALDTFMTKVEEQSQGSDGADDAGFRGFQPVEFVKTDVDEQRRGPRNFYAVSFPQGILWGIMGCAAGFGISLVSERTSGTLVRLRMSPISRVQILAGKGLACLLTVVAVCVVMLVFAAVVFQVRPTTPALLPAAIASVAICFVGVMMLLAVVGKTERAAGGIGWAILTVMAMIGGGMVPVFIMPAWMQGISTISPVRWAIIAIEGAVWRSYSVAEMWLPCVILLSIGVGCFAIGARAFRWTEGA